MKLEREFYIRDDVTQVARELLGKNLMVNLNGSIAGGQIVESEAYCGAMDRASHAYKNKLTPRTQTMFLTGGIAYVYLCYGIHSLFNIVTNMEGKPDAVLIRAVKPIKGVDSMKKRRNDPHNSINLTNGPGKLSQALGIDLGHDGMDLLGNKIWIEEGDSKITSNRIVVSKRIGVDYAGEDANLPWRFYIQDCDWVSKK